MMYALGITLMLFSYSSLIFFLGIGAAEMKYQKQAIEQGCAEYDKTTGVWQWKGE